MSEKTYKHISNITFVSDSNHATLKESISLGLSSEIVWRDSLFSQSGQLELTLEDATEERADIPEGQKFYTLKVYSKLDESKAMQKSLELKDMLQMGYGLMYVKVEDSEKRLLQPSYN